jgi:uncharacterized protein YndB with AHSA1/START domain/predicted enzyme related to lactoylglutathione lyase
MEKVRQRRTIEAPPAKVFEAWTDPELIGQWIAPVSCTVIEAVADARPGGRYSITARDAAGNLHRTWGEYREVVPGRRLVKTWSHAGPERTDDAQSLLTVEFRELRSGVTELTLTHARREAAGEWALCLERLAATMGGPPATRRELLKYAAGAATLGVAALLAAQYSKGRTKTTMRIDLSSVLVDNQDKALKFYTEVLGFVKKLDIPMGEFRWLTVVSPEAPDGTQLVLEPNANPAAKTFQEAMFKQGIPLTSLGAADVGKEYERMTKLGVVFKQPPTKAGPVTITVFEDTCGNLIQLHQV